MRYVAAILQFSILFLCSALSGCRFDSYTESPEITGSFKNNGVPEKGVQVFSGPMADTDDEHLCNGIPKTTETNEAGNFVLKEKVRSVYFGLPPDFKQKSGATVVCFSQNGQKPFFGIMLLVIREDTRPLHIDCAIPTHPTGHFEDGHVCY